MFALRCLSLLLFTIATSNSWAVISPIAITGDTIPGLLSSAEYASFNYAQLNSDGQGVYSATLQTGLGGISTANDEVLIFFNGALNLKAQSGSGNVAGAAGKDYASFQEFKIADSGDVLLKATLVETGDVNALNKQGYWRFPSSGASSLITRTGTSVVPGITSGKYLDLGARVATSYTNDFAFLGHLEQGSGVGPDNDFGIWRFQESTGTLVARENTSAPSVVGGLFNSFGQPATNAANQIAFRATMKTAGSITMANRLGVWVYNAGTGQMIARANSADVPGSSSDFTAFEDPLINEAGQVAIRGTLATGQQGLWLYNGTSGYQLAITNQVGVAGVPAASFTSLGKPLLTTSGKAVALGGLTTGVGDVTALNDVGLWLFDEVGSDLLLAREGVGNAGIAGASFASFEHIAPIDDSKIFLNATLQLVPGIVNSSNDEGIWRVPFTGAPELLLRKGDSLAGRTIADLWFPAGEFDETPLTGISNASGELLFHASFTNGDSGLFLYSPGTVTEFAEADFNEDGDVDQSDLATWQSAFGINDSGDADADSDTDGRDFLIWQRQYTGPGTVAAAAAIPEPGVLALLGLAVFCAPFRANVVAFGRC